MLLWARSIIFGNFIVLRGKIQSRLIRPLKAYLAYESLSIIQKLGCIIFTEELPQLL